MSTNPRRPDAPALTEQQRRPLTVRGASVSLSAGAGCGKTTVLTERFLGALGGPDGPDPGRRPLRSVVALTFTEKAARELRKRIRDECQRRLAACRGEDAAYWRSVVRGLEAAPIDTFHGFCQGLLRRHALDAGVDPGFQVLDEDIAGSLLDEALTRCVRRWLSERNVDLIELAVDYGLRTVRGALEGLVRGRGASEMAAWAGRTEGDVLAAWRSHWERSGRPALIRRFLDSARDCRELLEANECRNPVMAGRRAALLANLEALGSGEEPAAALAGMIESAKVQGGGRAEHWPSPEVYEAVKTRLTGLRKTARELQSRLEPDEAASERGAAHGLRYARLAADARDAYDAAKRARGGLDFDDLLVKTRDLLDRHAEAVREAEGRPVEFVLVDEFQDTDPTQSEILRRITGAGFASGRLFVVGDFKQSIYRFRGAEPGLFQTYREAFPEAGRHDLTENFRSASGVVGFVNSLFEKAFPGENPPLVPGPHSAPAAEGPAVEFVWAEPSAPAEGARPARADAGRKAEALWLARLVRSRLAAGWPVRDRKTREVRPAGAGDVAFLFRAMTDLAAYEQALAAEGLDYHVVGGKAFYAQQEVQDLVNVLSVVEDPLDAVALAGALRGPFFGLSDDGLFWLGGGHSAHGDLPGGLARFESVAALSAGDRLRAARARDLLGRWRGLKDRLPIAGLVDRVLDESGFEAALLGESLGDRKRANARKLVRLARRFDARGGFALAHFVAKLRADLRNPPREEQAATTEEEGSSVRLMSIHQAKGLEFPIVVVPDLNRRQDPGRKPVMYHPALGPLVRPAGSGPAEGFDADDGPSDEGGSGRPLGLVSFEAVERVAEDEEAVRLFYVATTRARDHLILSAGVGPSARPDSAALRLLAGRFDRASGSCRADLPDGYPAPEVRVTTQCPPPEASAPRLRKRRPRLRAVARVIRSAGLAAETDPARRAPAPPRYVDLDAVRGLPPRTARFDRLVRSILADPKALQVGKPALADLTRLAARRQEPQAHADLIAEAMQAVAPWLSGPVGRGLASASAVERGAQWTVTWPGETGATVFHGRTEFFARDAGGVWRAFVVSPPGAADAVERLRLLLSARAAPALGLGPVVQGWRLRAGDGVLGEEDFGDDAIGAAVRAALEAIRS